MRKRAAASPSAAQALSTTLAAQRSCGPGEASHPVRAGTAVELAPAIGGEVQHHVVVQAQGKASDEGARRHLPFGRLGVAR